MIVKVDSKTIKIKTKASPFVKVKLGAKPICKVSLDVDDESMGCTSGSGLYEEGSVVKISAEAYDRYVFDRWSDGNEDAQRTIVVDEDISLTAFFKIKFGILTYIPNKNALNTV